MSLCFFKFLQEAEDIGLQEKEIGEYVKQRNPGIGKRREGGLERCSENTSRREKEGR